MGIQRTLVSPAAATAAQQMKSILQGGLRSEIQRLDSQAKVLSEPNNWDGGNAIRFRSDIWPSANRTLQTLLQDLDKLQNALDQCLHDIATAGGGH